MCKELESDLAAMEIVDEPIDVDVPAETAGVWDRLAMEVADMVQAACDESVKNIRASRLCKSEEGQCYVFMFVGT